MAKDLSYWAPLWKNLVEKCERSPLKEVQDYYFSNIQLHSRFKGRSIHLAAESSGYDASLYLLHKACIYNPNEEVAIWLMEEGMVIDRPDKHGSTPFMLAVHSGLYMVVRYMCKNKPSQHGKIDKEGRSVWHYCFGPKEMFDYGLSHQLVPSPKYYDNSRRLDIAELLNTKEALPKFLSKKENEESLLAYALKNGHTYALEYFVKQGHIIHCASEPLEIELLKIPKWGHIIYNIDNKSTDSRAIKQVKYLNVNALDDHGNSVLHYVATKQRIVDSENIDIQKQPTEKPTDDLISCHTACAEELLTSGADVNITNREGHTPLEVACCSGFNEIMKLLVKSGGKVLRSGTPEVKETLIHREIRKALANQTKKADEIIKNADEEIAYLKDQIGISIDEKDSNGQTPLHYLCEYTPKSDQSIEDDVVPQMVTTLLKHGSNINALDANGSTPLMLSITGNRNRMVTLLLQNHVDMNIKYDDRAMKLAEFMGEEYVQTFEKEGKRRKEESTSAEDDEETKHVTILQSYMAKLVDRVRLQNTNLWDIVVNMRIISLSDAHYIKQKNNEERDQVRELLQELCKRPYEDYEKFLKALRIGGQANVEQMLIDADISTSDGSGPKKRRKKQ